jgi:hypothetical protein
MGVRPFLVVDRARSTLADGCIPARQQHTAALAFSASSVLFAPTKGCLSLQIFSLPDTKAKNST